MPYPVTFFPTGKTVQVDSHTTLLQAAVQAGLLLDSPCGGGGTCAKCRVRIRSGHASTAGSSHRLSDQDLADGWRLACGTEITEPLVVEVPQTSLVPRIHNILVDGDSSLLEHDPHAKGHLGVAIDLGTTSVAATLYDLHTGLERATNAVMNRQIRVGDDVISRIAFARSAPANLAGLQALAVASINEVIGALCATCGENAETIHKLTVAGNTAMQQILLGIDPSPLGEHPFTPAFTDAQTVAAITLGVLTHPEATLTVFPQIGGFVGGDTVAGLLASHFEERVLPSMLVDIGTNGEIALQQEGRILAASTAAGPAFEGARIRQGMRATTGAIDHVWLKDGDIHCHIIGDAHACGLCGSALVDAVAELLRVGLVAPDGLLAMPAIRPATLTDTFAARLMTSAKGNSFALAYDDAGVPSVVLTQQDIRELQLASSAIRSGIETLLNRAGLAAHMLDAILLAGGFGNYLRRENALRIGLLPPIHDQSIRFIGNASLTGAKLALLAQSELSRAQSLRSRTTHVDLATEPGFADLFMDHMLFPMSETDGLFHLAQDEGPR